jgi:hypothetical protein
MAGLITASSLLDRPRRRRAVVSGASPAARDGEVLVAPMSTSSEPF